MTQIVRFTQTVGVAKSNERQSIIYFNAHLSLSIPHIFHAPSQSIEKLLILIDIWIAPYTWIELSEWVLILIQIQFMFT